MLSWPTLTPSTLQGRLSTRYRSVFMGIFDHSSRSAFVRSGTDVGEKAWLAVSALINPKGVLSGWGQDSVQASQAPPHQTCSSMSLWTLLEQEGVIPKLNVEALRIPFTGTKGPSPTPEKQPHIKLYTWHNAVRQVPFSWQPPNPDSSIVLCSRVQWRRALHHCIRHFALHLVM